MAETRLSVDDLIWPVFVRSGAGKIEEVSSMPGAERVSLDRLAAHVETAAQLRIPMVALFPVTSAELKDADGTEATNPDNLICQAARLLKREFPELGLLGDVALDLYTTHGHDGVLRDGRVANDESVAVLARIIHRTARNRPRPPNTWARDFIAKNFTKQPIRIVVNDIKGLALTAHFS